MSVTRRAGVYTRISVDRNGESESPERQEADCRALAEQRGWTVAHVYGDRDTSAYSRKVTRPRFDQLVRDLRAGVIDAVIVWKVDRLTRQGVVGISRFLEVLEDAGAELVSATEPFLDTTTPMGRGVLGFIASMAEQESANISLRVKRAHQSSATSGRMHSGGSRQYGYTRDGQVDPGEAEVIREAAKRVLDGESLRSIAADLNARGIRTSSAGEKRKPRAHQVIDPELLDEDGRYQLTGEWRSVTLGQMLRSPRVAGIRVHEGNRIRGAWDPIISEELHEQLVTALGRGNNNGRVTGRSHLLTGAGVTRCGLCGRPMRRMSFRQKGTRDERLFHRYQCARQPGQSQCGKVAISQVSTDNFVVGELLDFLHYAEMRPLDDESESESQLEDELVEAQAALADLDQQRYVRRTMNQSRWEQLARPLEAEIAALEGRLSDLRRRREERAVAIPLGDRDALGAWWEAATDVEHIAAVRQAVKTVTVHPAKRRGGNRFDHARIAIDWNWETFRLTEGGQALERFWNV